MTYWMLPLTFPLVLQSIVLTIVALPLARPRGMREGIIVLEWWPWFDRKWPFTTCLAYVLASEPWLRGTRKALWFHEVGVHVKQYEEMTVIGAIIGAVVFGVTGNWVLALSIWGTSGPLWMAPGLLTSARYRQAWKELGWSSWRGLYRFAWFERDAHAQESQFIRNGGA